MISMSDNKPTVISILNEKGGCGKTTIATNLAHGLELRGKKTLLIDSDPQGSARDWNKENEGSLVRVIGLDRKTLPVDLKAIWGGYEIVVIDGAPGIQDMLIAALKVTDIVLIPVQPSPYDVWATAGLVELIKSRQAVTENQLRAAFIISRAIKNTILSRDIQMALQEYDLPVFASYTSQHVGYAKTAVTGQSLYSIASEYKKEIEAIIDELERKFL